MTTGLALVVAGVIVANPVIAPRADIQIPAVQLSSGSDEAGGMLDKAFLDAIAPAPPESTNPLAVLKQLFSSLAADATHIGKNALVDAFVAGVTAVSEPELTSAWSPYVVPPADASAVAATVLPSLNFPDLALPSPDVAAALPDLSDPVAVVAGSISPAVRDFVSSLVHDVGYVSGELVSAAFAVGALVAAEPVMIVDTLSALVKGDLEAALTNAVKVVTAPFGPPAIIVNALRTVVEKNLAQLNPLFAPPQVEPAQSEQPALSPVVAAAPPAATVTQRPVRRAPAAAPSEDPVTPLVPTAAAAERDPGSVEPVTAVLDSSEIRSSASSSAATPKEPVNRKPAAAAREAVKAVSEQIGAVVDDVADAVGRGAGRAGAGGRGSTAE